MAEINRVLLSAIIDEQEQLKKMVGNQRERLTNEDVYVKSLELDQLIVQFMKNDVNWGYGSLAKE